MQTSKPMVGISLGLQFMARGITWAPSYIIDITHPEKDVLTAKALIINEAIDLNTLTGEIHIKNSQNRTIDMAIEKTTNGDVIDASSDGSLSYSGSGLKKIIPNSRIVWNIKLPPIEDNVLTYSYKVYIRD